MRNLVILMTCLTLSISCGKKSSSKSGNPPPPVPEEPSLTDEPCEGVDKFALASQPKVYEKSHYAYVKGQQLIFAANIADNGTIRPSGTNKTLSLGKARQLIQECFRDKNFERGDRIY